MLKIAFLGLGRMGLPMAKRLIEAGYSVSVWNRSPAPREALRAALKVSQACEILSSPIEAVHEADLTITMLTDGAAVKDLLFHQGVADALKKQSVFIDMSSIPPEVSREIDDALKKRAVAAVDAPVSGGVVGAEAGTLAIMAGGDRAVVAKLQDTLAPLGRLTFVGPPGSGQLAKLANQVIVGITIGAVAEALLLAKKGGADPEAVRAAIRGGFAESRILEVHGARMLQDSYVPGGAVNTQIKDLTTALQEAEACGLQLPVTALLQRLFTNAGEAGDGGLDHAALLREIARMNGLSPTHTLGS